MSARVIITGGLALLASWQVVRTAVVSAYAEQQPEIAERIWPGHPQVVFTVAMAEIGQAAAGGQTTVPAAVLDRIERASAGAPLAVEPFLIKGTHAKAERREQLAERLFVEARARDPRSPAARYFLAERYLSQGRAAEGLNEVSALVRLVPGGSQAVVPGLAEFARTPGAAEPLRKMFETNPDIGHAVLAQLASETANAGLIMQIAGQRVIGGSDEPAPAWQSKLLNALIERSEFAKAQNLWSRFAGIQLTTPGVVNKDFAKINAPPPFNWSFASGTSGVAEPARSGKLNVIFYGRENVDLASQLLVLPAGPYRIQLEATGETGADSGLEWAITCLPGGAKIASVPLRRVTLTGVKLGGAFTVPDRGCAAQWLKLIGAARDIAKSEQATIGQFEILPASGQ